VRHAFVMMQIGNPELDRVYDEAIAHAIGECGLEARRVDKHNEGGLLKSEILRFLQQSDILIADVTNERPNVYLEIGYAMGIDKFRNLILTVREDHFADSPNHRVGGPKVHFDLAGYDILRWHPGDLDAFRTELTKRIRRRLAIVTVARAPERTVWDDEWIEAQRQIANAGFVDLGLSGFQVVMAALDPKIDRTQVELDNAARQAEIRTFGWPFGVYLANREDARPHPRADGVVAEVRSLTKDSYDYWAIRRNGDLYSASSLFEDKRQPGALYFNTRIVRATETLLYCLRLYSALGVDRSTVLNVRFGFGGLRNRVLISSNPNRSLSLERKSVEDRIETDVAGTLDDIEAHLVDKVVDAIAPVFRLFEFFELPRPVYEDIVEKIVAGRVE
jgi:hypothetical protein